MLTYRSALAFGHTFGAVAVASNDGLTPELAIRRGQPTEQRGCKHDIAAERFAKPAHHHRDCLAGGFQRFLFGGIHRRPRAFGFNEGDGESAAARARLEVGSDRRGGDAIRHLHGLGEQNDTCVEILVGGELGGEHIEGRLVNRALGIEFIAEVCDLCVLGLAEDTNVVQRRRMRVTGGITLAFQGGELLLGFLQQALGFLQQLRGFIQLLRQGLFHTISCLSGVFLPDVCGTRLNQFPFVTEHLGIFL